MGKELCKQSEARLFVLFESYFSKLNRDIATQNSKAEDTSKKVGCAWKTCYMSLKRERCLKNCVSVTKKSIKSMY